MQFGLISMSDIPLQPGLKAKCLNARHCRHLIQPQCVGSNSITEPHDEHGFVLHCVSIGAAEIGIDIFAAFFNQLR